MSWGWAVFTYLVTWWVTLLPMLSLKLRYPEARGREHYAGAPESPGLLWKMLLNSLVAAVIVLGLHLLLKSGAVPLRDAV